jgi:hypothetical protein
MAINLEKAPRKRAVKPIITPAVSEALGRAYVPPTYTHPGFACGSTRTVNGVDWNVTLYSDDSVRISRDTVPVATGRFVTESHVTAWGSLSVESRIVDVTPAAAVAADIVESLAGDLTYFAMRAGRFSHCPFGKAVRS